MAVAAAEQWSSIDGTNGMIKELTLSLDDKTGDYSRLTKFKAGASTISSGGKMHDYPEEIYIISK